MNVDIYGEQRPARVNSARLKCAHCHRVFAAGYVPAPMTYGRYHGQLLCIDCREELERPPQPGLFDHGPAPF